MKGSKYPFFLIFLSFCFSSPYLIPSQAAAPGVTSHRIPATHRIPTSVLPLPALPGSSVLAPAAAAVAVRDSGGSPTTVIPATPPLPNVVLATPPHPNAETLAAFAQTPRLRLPLPRRRASGPPPRELSSTPSWTSTQGQIRTPPRSGPLHCRRSRVKLPFCSSYPLSPLLSARFPRLRW
jgi:hypothetical protein